MNMMALYCGARGCSWHRIPPRGTNILAFLFLLFLADLGRGQNPLPLRGHKGHITSVVFSRDSKSIASGGADDTIRLWNANTGKELSVLNGYMAGDTRLAFSADGKSLISAGYGRIYESPTTGEEANAHGLVIFWWDVATGKKRSELRLADVGSHRALSTDGTLLAESKLAEGINVWNLDTGKKLCALPQQRSRVHCTAFSPDGKIVVTGYGDGMVRCWDTATGKEVEAFKAHEKGVNGLAFTPDGKLLATGSFTGQEAKVWEGKPWKERARLKGSIGAELLAFSPDGKMLAVGSTSGSRLAIRDAAAQKVLAELKVSNGSALAISPDGKKLVVAYESRWLHVWDMPKGNE
ncbi:MAG: WD40 repeat domain-containing protein [Gemmataceae bacterium]|nr:WD40 repeat domain-containing protein [Gemmataceae bacterium]